MENYICLNSTFIRRIIVLSLFNLILLTAYSQKVIFKQGKGLQVLAADSSAFMKVGFRFQPLFTTSRLLNEDSETRSNFLIRRARLKFEGWAFQPEFSYKFELGLSASDVKSGIDDTALFEGVAGKGILDAVVKWKFAQNWTLHFGQSKLPGNRERLISSQKLQLVDRSILNSIFTLDRDIGIQLHGSLALGNAVLRPILSIAKGDGRNVVSSNSGGYQYTVKLEVLPFGKFQSKGDYFEGDLKRESEPKLSIAVAYDYNDGASRQRVNRGKRLFDDMGSAIHRNVSTVFADLMFKHKGLSIMAEYANRQLDGSNPGFHTGSGFNFQMGLMVGISSEIAARYAYVESDDANTFSDSKEYVVAFSKYIHTHSLKVQTDLGLLDIASQSDLTFRGRIQFELSF